MKRVIFCNVYFLCAAFSLFAGDVAAFRDMGFSTDGKTYLFAEYGKTDTTFQGYAKIYTVDVEKNDFVPGGIFQTLPSTATANKNGFAVYEELAAKNNDFISRYNSVPVSSENRLYIRKQDAASSSDEITFQDFRDTGSDPSIYYSVKLVSNVQPKGNTVSSSFFIALEKKDDSGKILERLSIGNPQIQRDGVSDYVINSIFTDPSEKSLVFVIEKIIKEQRGISVRYMVETYRYK